MTNYKDVGERPNCPECNEPNPMSAGLHWQCKKCGRTWTKVRREHPPVRKESE